MVIKIAFNKLSKLLCLSVGFASYGSSMLADDRPTTILRGPDDIESRIEEINRPKESAFDFPAVDSALKPWSNWKSKLADNGFRLGFDYNFLGQSANNTVGDDTAIGGIFRGYISWDMWNRSNPSRSGTLDTRVENRHAFGNSIPPEDFAFNFGWAGTTGPDWTGQEWGLPVFMLRQRLDIGEVPIELRIGRMSAFAQFDITPFSDNLTTFANNSIILSPTIAYPSAGSLGIAGYVGFPRSNLYVLGMLMDANGSYDDLGFGTLEQGEFFKGLEFGWSEAGVTEGPSYLVNNVHVALWQSDERGQGAALTGSYIFDESRVGVFGRLGYASADAATLYQKHAAAGVTKGVYRDSQVGLAASWGQVMNTGEDQIATELYYRWQMAQNVAITPSIQFLSNPALNSVDPSVVVWSLRARITF